MLTIRFDRLGLLPGQLVLDVGAGFGRHAFAAARLGARVVALDFAANEVTATRNTFGAMLVAGEITPDSFIGSLRGDATQLPFANSSFDHIITSEVLEHIQNDVAGLNEFARLIKPGGSLAITVPTWWPEKINWMLSDEYYAPKSVGGHVRIYSETELKAKIRASGFQVTGSHHAHALHSPYWWLRCAVGLTRENHPLVQRYKSFLEWDIIKRPRSTQIAERLLSPVLGKSLIIYARRTTSS